MTLYTDCKLFLLLVGKRNTTVLNHSFSRKRCLLNNYKRELGALLTDLFHQFSLTILLKLWLASVTTAKHTNTTVILNTFHSLSGFRQQKTAENFLLELGKKIKK